MLEINLLRPGVVLVSTRGVFFSTLFIQERAEVVVIEPVCLSYETEIRLWRLRVRLSHDIWYVIELPQSTILSDFSLANIDDNRVSVKEEPVSANHTAELSKEDLYNYVRKFIAEQKISCPESIHQSDRVSLSACDFVEKCCEYVGYAQELVVNGATHMFCGTSISYREIIALAGFDYSDYFSLTYRGPKKEDSRREGILSASQSIPFESGMIFNVIMTNGA